MMEEKRQLEVSEKELHMLIFYRSLSKEKKELFEAFMESLMTMMQDEHERNILKQK